MSLCSRHAVRVVVVLAFWAFSALGAAAQPPVAVTAADPSSGEQETTGLVVKVKGKNFAAGASVDFFRSGTSDPAGITVRSTRYVNSTEVETTIDIAAGAAVSLFDIRVTNTNGRSGKGSDLFRVNSKALVCVIPETDPAHFQLLGTFNNATGTGPKYSGYLGLSLGVGEALVPLPGEASARPLVVFAGTLGSGLVEVFFVDPITGGVLDGSPLGATASPQPHITLALPYVTITQGPWIPDIAVADLNGDNVPDAVASDNGNLIVAGLLSHVDASGVVGYTVTAFPLPPTVDYSFGQALAIGELDGIAGLEVAVSQKDTSTKSLSRPARIYVYRLGVGGASFDLVYTMTATTQSGDNFGNTIAVGDVTGDGRPDLIGGAPYRDTGRATDAGAVLVFQGTGASPPYRFSGTPLVLTLATPLKYDGIGRSVFVGNSDSDPLGRLDVLTLSGEEAVYNPAAPPIRGLVFRGPIGPETKETPGDTFAPPAPALAKAWGLDGDRKLLADLDQDGLSDLVVGAHQADATPQCQFAGIVYSFHGQLDPQGTFAGWQRRQIFAPPGVPGTGFGAAVAAAAPWQLLFVGETGRTLDGVSYAGQIYVYRVY